MPDISMCMNQSCPLRMNCFRYRAKANPFRQAFGSFTFTSVEGGAECEYFWDIKEKTTELTPEIDLK